MDRSGGGGEDAAGWWGVNQLISPRSPIVPARLRDSTISLTVDTSLTGETHDPIRLDTIAHERKQSLNNFPSSKSRKIGNEHRKVCSPIPRTRESKPRNICIPSLTFSSREASFKTLQYQHCRYNVPPILLLLGCHRVVPLSPRLLLSRIPRYTSTFPRFHSIHIFSLFLPRH